MEEACGDWFSSKFLPSLLLPCASWVPHWHSGNWVEFDYVFVVSKKFMLSFWIMREHSNCLFFSILTKPHLPHLVANFRLSVELFSWLNVVWASPFRCDFFINKDVLQNLKLIYLFLHSLPFMIDCCMLYLCIGSSRSLPCI